MEIVLLTIGKINTSYIIAGIEEYIKRIKRYVQYNIIDIPDIKKAGKITFLEQKELEGDALLKQLNDSDKVFLLDERGKEFTSREFSSQLEKILGCGKKRVVFVVGGPYGFSQKVYARADALLSLSKMTFNHEMVRLFFTEQIYRALSIIHGLPYHHD